MENGPDILPKAISLPNFSDTTDACNKADLRFFKLGGTTKAGAEDILAGNDQDMEVPGIDHPERSHYVIEDPGSGRLYNRGNLLGKGAFGRCYKCTDVSSRQVYAVKMISHTRKIVIQQRGGVEKEIELHSQLKHRNIVRFYHHFRDQKYMYLVMEYCRHKSLAHILKVRKLLTEPEVRYYMKQILQGVQFLHQQGVIHRDLKL
ncbi:unnamed protein product, partial [Ranitomeya imitator]